MCIAESFRFAEPDTVDHAGMVQRVADDGIPLIEQDFEQASVGIEAGAVEDRLFGTQKLADGTFELDM